MSSMIKTSYNSTQKTLNSKISLNMDYNYPSLKCKDTNFHSGVCAEFGIWGIGSVSYDIILTLNK